MPFELQTPEFGAIVPVVVKTPAGKTAMLRWTGQLTDRTLRNAILREENFLKLAHTDLYQSRHGDIAWFILALSTKEEFLRTRNPDPFFVEICYPPETFRSSPYREWLELIEKQSRLLMQLPHPNKGTPRLVETLQPQQLRTYSQNLRYASERWGIGCDYERAAAELQSYINKTALPLLFDALDEQAELFASEPQAHLIHIVAAHAQGALPESSTLYQLAQLHDFTSIEANLQAWRQSRGDKSIVLQQSSDPEEDLRRGWLFCQLCLESPRSRKILHMPFGLTPEGTWFMRPVPFDGDIDSIWNLRHYRYFLAQVWSRIAKPNDIAIRTLTNLVTLSVLDVPKQTDFSSLGKFLRGSLLDKRFNIMPLSTVVLNQPSLREIVFLPSKSDIECLFKVVLEVRDRYSMCAFGSLNAATGEIRLHGHPESDEGNQTATELLLYLVALAYRDLIVARDILLHQPATTKSEPQRRGSKAFTRKSLSASEQVILLPRINPASLGQNLGSVDRVRRSLSELAPHFRIDHLRQLPPGWKASLAQLQLAEDLNVFVPAGYTYVRESNPTGSSREEVQEKRRLFRSLSLLELMFT